ncbi:hypothetical protein ANANG_G00315140 [Anguilla anguilla]|uniref:Methyltransferase domain-containing protein n=1 Tax=Anguilla anguilla TaxID=7936 RepID=A0A9D3LIT7_ANGAN|nr:hypothetical protein ANANG_G00315140 [Anguilla anguilla]
MSVLESVDVPLELTKGKIDELRDFLKISLSIANAHTVDFYTCNVWEQFIAVPPESVLSIFSSKCDQRVASENRRTQSCQRRGGKDRTNFGFCDDTKRLVDVAVFLDAAKRHTLPGLGVCVLLPKVLQALRGHQSIPPAAEDVPLEPEEFMNAKKSHEVQILSGVVASLAQQCGVRQVIDVGSGKGYLCSFLSLQYGLQVYGIDSSSRNTHGAQERNRKLQKYSRAYQRHHNARTAISGGEQGAREQLQEERDRSEQGGEQRAREQLQEERDRSERGGEQGAREQLQEERDRSEQGGEQRAREQLQEERDRSERGGESEERPVQRERDPSEQEGDGDCVVGFKPFQGQDTETLTMLLEASVAMAPVEDSPKRNVSDALSPDTGTVSSSPESPFPFLGVLSPELVEIPPPRTPPTQLSPEERERRKRENLERKGRGSRDSLFSPLTSYITAHTELRDIITHLEDALLVGLHTCGDLAPSTLRMFTAKPELRAVCSVGCCYHLLSEEFDPSATECPTSQWGFPMSKHLRDLAWFCGRNARMSACLALERVSAGGGLPSESLFYRAVLHVILRDHYAAFKSEKRVGNVYSKSASFLDYVRRALRKLGLDGSKISDCLIQGYHEKYSPRKQEMQAFNMLKVSLAPCIEALILLDRLCYLKEQENTCFSAVVPLFDPLMSPRCYGILALKNGASECSKNKHS